MMKKNVQKLTLSAILAASAVALSFLESLIPPISGMPPGAKLGFSNIATMFAVLNVGIPQAFFITVFKAVFAGITRGGTAFIMSLSGGLLSTALMCIMLKSKRQVFGYIGVGIACAAAHNTAQVIAAAIISGTPGIILGYLPFLMLFSIITGFATGAMLKILVPILNKTIKGDENHVR